MAASGVTAGSSTSGPRIQAMPDQHVWAICGARKRPDPDIVGAALEDCPEELGELRASLLQEHVWRQRKGL